MIVIGFHWTAIFGLPRYNVLGYGAAMFDYQVFMDSSIQFDAEPVVNNIKPFRHSP